MTVWAFQANRHGTAPFLAGPNSGKARSSCGGLRLVGIARDHGMAVDCLPILRTDIVDVKVHNIRQVLAYEATRADLRGVLGKIAGTQFANTGVTIRPVPIHLLTRPRFASTLGVAETLLPRRHRPVRRELGIAGSSLLPMAKSRRCYRAPTGSCDNVASAA